jgi:hypothetical protein
LLQFVNGLEIADLTRKLEIKARATTIFTINKEF